MGTSNGRWYWDAGFRAGLGWIQAGYGNDLGTANTVVAGVDGMLLLDEPWVMAVRADGERQGQLVAVGLLLSRTPIGMGTVRQREDGSCMACRGHRKHAAGPDGRWHPRATNGRVWPPQEATDRRFLVVTRVAGVPLRS